MKKRIRSIVNFMAFNILFFALYLNFIHKDKAGIIDPEAPSNTSVGLNKSVLAENPSKYLLQESAKTENEGIINSKQAAKAVNTSPAN